MDENLMVCSNVSVGPCDSVALSEGRTSVDRLNRRRSPVYDDYPVGGVPPIDRRPSPPPSFYRGRSPPPYGNRPRSRSPMRFARSRSPMRRYRSPSPFRNGGPRYPPPGPDGPLPPLNDMPLGGPPYADAYPPPRGMSPSRPFHPAGSRFSPPPRPYDRGPPPFDDRFDYRARSPDRDRDFGRRPFRSQSPPPFRGEPPYRGRSREREVYDYDRNMQGWPPSPPRREMTPEGPEGRLLPNPNDSERLLPFSAWTRWFWQVQPEIVSLSWPQSSLGRISLRRSACHRQKKKIRTTLALKSKISLWLGYHSTTTSTKRVSRLVR